MTDVPDPRAGLLAAKLGALVHAHWTDQSTAAQPGAFPSGATLVDRASGRAWILIEDDGARRLGAALAIAERAGVTDLHLIVDEAEQAAILARRAGQFARPPSVWLLTGTAVSRVEPADPAVDQAPAPAAELYRPVLADAGLEPVVEGGSLIGELRGLEVARVVVDDDGSSAHVEAGVGRFDREVGAMMFAQLAEVDALARAVDVVAEVRIEGAARHPLNQLVPERWLRSVLVAQPELVGAAHLRPVGSAVPRESLRDAGVASAVGEDLDGQPIVVTCSTGVDLELVPTAADDRLTHAPGARLILAVPARDALPVTTQLAGHLVHPADVITIDDAWRTGLTSTGED